jgi:integrase
MSLYRRGRIWWIELSSQSGRVRESAGTADKKAAQEYHEKRKGEIWRQDKLGEAPPPTWGEAVAKWLKIKTRSEAERYMLRAMGFDPLSTLPLSKDSLERSLSAQSSGTFNRHLSLVVAIHNASGVKPPEIQRRKTPPGRTRWLTSEEWARLRTCLEEESQLLRQCAEFTLATGLRENNVLELEWEQVSWATKQAWIHPDQAKAGKAIGVPLNADACRILKERVGVHKKWVFGNPDHPLTRASNRAWYAARRKAKLSGFRWHDLRHTWASWAVMSGVRLEELQRMGGWATAQMVQRYAHLSTEHLADAAARIKPISLRYNAPKRGRKDTKIPTTGA